jgi:hypothetical protein
MFLYKLISSVEGIAYMLPKILFISPIGTLGLERINGCANCGITIEISPPPVVGYGIIDTMLFFITVSLL